MIFMDNPQLTGKKTRKLSRTHYPPEGGTIRLRCASDGHPDHLKDASDRSLVLEPVPFSKGLSPAHPTPRGTHWRKGRALFYRKKKFCRALLFFLYNPAAKRGPFVYLSVRNTRVLYSMVSSTTPFFPGSRGQLP
jgi:hypothetical protein